MSDPTGPSGPGGTPRPARGERRPRPARDERGERAAAAGTRVGDGGSPIGSPLTIGLALVAVLVGFLIFRTIDSGSAIGVDNNQTAEQPAGDDDPRPDEQSTATSAPPTTAAPVDAADVAPTDADVVAINAAAQGGVAGNFTGFLGEAGYSMAEPVTGVTEDGDAQTVVYYDESDPVAQAVAQMVADDLQVSRVEPAPAGGVELIEGDSVGSATVYVWIGTDTAMMTRLPPDQPDDG